MKLIFKELIIRNFLSFGNVPQSIDLTKHSYQIITGQNKDKSDNEEDKNGVGKSTIQQAIHYALFGKSTGNRVNLGYLINNINQKNMVVMLKFSKDDIEYEITRGRSPNIFKLLRNGEEIIDESQGDSRETQKELESIVGFGDDLYNQLFNLSCCVDMFLGQSSTNQKLILEKILGVDTISKKIVALKELIKSTKNDLNNETFKYNTIKTQNETISATIIKQTDEITVAKNNWIASIEKNINDAKAYIEKFCNVDFTKEIENIKLLNEYDKLLEVNKQNQQLKDNLQKSIEKNTCIINEIQAKMQAIQSFDFTTEKANHQYNDELDKEIVEYEKTKIQHESLKKYLEQTLYKQFKDIGKKIELKEAELNAIKDNLCPVCGKPLDEDKVESLREAKKTELKDLREHYHKVDMEIMEVNSQVQSFVEKQFIKKPVTYASMNDVLNVENSLTTLGLTLNQTIKETLEMTQKASEIVIQELPKRPTTMWTNVEDAIMVKSSLQEKEKQITEYQKQLSEDPFQKQEQSLEEMKSAIIALDDSTINELSSTIVHQETLLKLLNSPSSFIRKTILDKSLEFLNNRIATYLEKMGSMHSITFNNDMTIKISKMGVDYGYISSGEEGRVSMALTFAFRDVWEALNNCNVNLWFFDEVIDRLGLDEAGVDLLVEIIKAKADKNVFIVTHNSKLISQTENIIKLVKENDFTAIVK